jgi:hypothetical protein
MDLQKKRLIGIILYMIKDLYIRTTQLENLFNSSNIHILNRDFDPFNELLKALELTEEKNTYLLELVQLFLEDQMTLEELVLAFENQVAETQSA